MEKAIFELNEKLKHPSDLESKLDSILNRYRALVDSNIQAAQGQEMDRINCVVEMKSSMQTIEKLLENINDLKLESKEIILAGEYSMKEYKTILELSNAYENFVKISALVENFKNPITSKDEDFLEYHRKVFSLEEFAYEVKNQSYGLDQKELAVVECKLDEVKKFSLQFSSALFTLLEQYIENLQFFDAIEKIVEKEEKRDSLIEKVKIGSSSNSPIYIQYYKDNSRYLLAEKKMLKERVIKQLNTAIAAKFSNLKQDTQYLSKIDFLADDLKALKEINLSFFGFLEFAKAYHRGLKDLIDYKLSAIKPEEILGLFSLKIAYFNTVEGELNIIPESIGPPLIENERDVLNKYSLAASEKLKEWIDNITEKEIEKFLSRDPTFNEDDQGRLLSSGFINMLQIIKVQLEPVEFNKKVFLMLATVIKGKCEAFRKKIFQTMKNELKNAISGKGLSGFEDYCTVFGNSGLKLAHYISSLPFFQSYEVRELQTIFLGIMKDSHDILSSYIIETCKPVIKKLFTDDWNEKSSFDVMILTLDDFLSDYEKVMSEYSFYSFLNSLGIKIYRAFVKQIQRASISLSFKSSKVIKDCYEKLEKMFLEFADKKYFLDGLALLVKLCPLINSVSAELFLIEAKALKAMDKELDKSTLMSILEKKTNMNSQERSIALEQVNELMSGSSSKKMSLFKKIIKKTI